MGLLHVVHEGPERPKDSFYFPNACTLSVGKLCYKGHRSGAGGLNRPPPHPPQGSRDRV